MLATIALGVGVAAGAAIGPAPDPSFAGGADGLAERLPQLAAALASRSQAPSQPPASATTAPTPAPGAPAVPPAAATPSIAAPAPSAPAPAATAPAERQVSGETGAPTSKRGALPAITSVWLVELAGGTLAEAKAQPAAAPYINGQLLPMARVLDAWSSLDASAFASEAVLVQPPAPGATPPLLHSIVQPPCPEGAAGAACAPGTAGAQAAADDFLKATLAPITGTAAYREHGLVVVTFASVGVAAQQELPAGASTATLTYQPPAGVALLSPFARAGVSATPYDPTSPKRSLEKLLR